MIRINLLPNDEVPKIRVFAMPAVGAFVPAFVAAGVLLLCAGSFLVQKRSHDQLEDQVVELRAENQRLAPQIARIKQLEREREMLDRRLDAITELDRVRYLRVHLMSEIARTWPENAWLSAVREITPSQVEIEGYTFNNFVVSDFLRDIDQSEYLDVLDLSFANRGKIQKTKIMQFSLTASVSQPVAPSGAGL